MTTATLPSLGTQAPERSYPPLTRTDFVRYQGASGDFHPLHHDEGYAQSLGFPTVFSVGMLQASLLASFATDWLGAETIRRFKVRFVEQVWPGDVLTCTGVVTGVTPAGADVLVDVDLTCTRQTGGVALAGAATFALEAG